jgi:hypothetical protein
MRFAPGRSTGRHREDCFRNAEKKFISLLEEFPFWQTGTTTNFIIKRKDLFPE